MTGTAGSTPGPAGPPAVLVGIDLLTARERHADELAFACATALRRRGGQDITVTTQEAALGERRHVALVIEVGGLEEEAVGAELLDLAHQVGGQSGYGLLAGTIFAGAAELQPVLDEVLRTHRAGTGGRAVVFPGSTVLVGTTTVAELIAGTRIDEVQVIGAPAPDGGTVLVTRGFVRPRWSGGSLVLHAQPAIGGALVPFETPDPTPCCASHG